MHRSLKMLASLGMLAVSTLAGAGVFAAQEASTPVNPPEGGTAPHRKHNHGIDVENRLANLSRQLNLTDEQKGKIRRLLKHEEERIHQLRNDTSLSDSQEHRRVTNIRRITREHIGEILTAEQKQKWLELSDDRHEGGKPETENGRPVV